MSAEELAAALAGRGFDVEVEPRGAVALIIADAGSLSRIAAAGDEVLSIVRAHGFTTAAVELPGVEGDATLLRD